MKVAKYCKRGVVSLSGQADVLEAAKLMRDRHVDLIVICSEADAGCRPIGVLTDRDIVLQVTARELSPRDVAVEDIMLRQPMIAQESDDLSELMQKMRQAGLRRVPVVDVRGTLTGIIAMDDVFEVISDQLDDLAEDVQDERRRAWP